MESIIFSASRSAPSPISAWRLRHHPKIIPIGLEMRSFLLTIRIKHPQLTVRISKIIGLIMHYCPASLFCEATMPPRAIA